MQARKFVFEVYLQFKFVSISCLQQSLFTLSVSTHTSSSFFCLVFFYLCSLFELLSAAVSLSLAHFNFVLLVTCHSKILILLPFTVHYISPILNTALYILFLVCLKVFLCVFLPRALHEIAQLYWFWCSQTTRVILSSPRSPLSLFLISDITLLLFKNLLSSAGRHPEPWKTGKWGHQA